MLTNRPEHSSLWINALTWTGSVTPRVIGLVVFFSFYSFLITFFVKDHTALGFEIGPFEVSGAILGLLLVLRTNAGYDRWWEARKLWGGIVNQCRNLAITALQYGPHEPGPLRGQDAERSGLPWAGAHGEGRDFPRLDALEWKKDIIKWTAAFPYVALHSLRGDRELAELEEFLSNEEIQVLMKARHMPSYVVGRIAECIQSARASEKRNKSGPEGQDFPRLDDFSFLQIDQERSALMHSIGACERILKTPIPLVIAIKVQRFILLFLILVPFVLIQKVGWYTPVFMFIISYPLLSLDQIGIELQNPFSQKNLSHLPLNEIAKTIKEDLFSFLESHLEKAKKG